MPADIVLSKDSVEIIEGNLIIGNNSIGPGKVNFRGTKDGALSFQFGSHEVRNTLFTVESVGRKTTVSGGTITASHLVRASRVRAEREISAAAGHFTEASVKELTVGRGDYEESSPAAGLINLKSSTGKKSIILDGDKGDIVFDQIGSLLAVIKDLQRQIDELKA